MAILSASMFEQPGAQVPGSTVLSAASPVREEDLTSFDDYPKIRQQIYDRTLESVQSSFPYKTDRYTVSVQDLKYRDTNPVPFQDQKKAVLEGKSVVKPLTGIYTVTDNATGQVLSKSGRKTIINVPYFTERGTYIRNGVEYSVMSQLRLSPGVYTRKTSDGMYEAQFNSKPGTGGAFRIVLDPTSAMFYLKHGTRRLPFYPIAQKLGIADNQLKQMWGEDLLKRNKEKAYSPHAINWISQIHERMAPKEIIEEDVAEDTTDKQAAEGDIDSAIAKTEEPVYKFFNRMELDPVAVQRTMGHGYSRVTPELMLESTNKLLKLSRGTAEADSRDALAYQTIHGFSDYLSGKIKMDQNATFKKHLWKMASKGGDANLIPTGALDPHVDHIFYSAKLSNQVEEISPIDMLNQNYRVIRLGEGAIPDVRAAPKEARAVQPSYVGFIDGIKSPECYSEDMEVWTSIGWKKWPDVTRKDKLGCLIDNQLQYHKPEQVVSYDYKGIMYGAESFVLGYLVTPEHRMWVRPTKSKLYRFELAEIINKKKRHYKSAGHLPIVYKDEIKEFSLPIPVKTSNHMHIYKKPIKMELWAEFMGWYLAEGCAVYNVQNNCYVASISQSRESNLITYMTLRNLMRRLPFNYCKEKEKGFRITTRQVAEYLKQFGKSDTKYIPNYIFKASVRARQKFLHAYLIGDGKLYKGKYREVATASEQMAKDLHRLMFELGISSTIHFHKDKRIQYKGCWNLHIHTRTCREAAPKSPYHPKGQMLKEQYSGKVYCASVPGGLMYVRRHNKCGFWCGNSLRIGLDMYLARNAKKGPDNKLYTKFLNPTTNKDEYIDTIKAADSIIAFPEMLESKDRFVPALVKGGNVEYVDRNSVNYVVRSGDDLFSYGSQTAPTKSGIKGMRLLMASKFASAALPLKEREFPLVSTVDQNGKSVMDNLGKFFGAVFADQSGKVEDVTKDHIKVRNQDGSVQLYPIYNDFMLARKTYYNNTPTVKAGDILKPGALMATSNFTDDKGRAAPGKNLRVGYMTYKGLNFEDSIVISESAAKKLSPQVMYSDGVSVDDTTKLDKQSFHVQFPKRYTVNQLDKLDDKGIVKPGTVIMPGDPMILALKERAPSLSNLNRRITTDESVYWDHPYPGIVTDIAKTDRGYKVFVKTEMPLQEADKLCYDDQTEILTVDGWKYFRDLEKDDLVASLNPETDKFEYIKPTTVCKYQHSGKMYSIVSQQIDLTVTPNHRLYLKKRYGKGYTDFGFYTPDQIFGKLVRYKKDGIWEGNSPRFIVIPGYWFFRKGGKSDWQPDITMEMSSFIMLLGMYLSEGYTIKQPQVGTYIVAISQTKPDTLKLLHEALDKCKIKYSRAANGDSTFIYSRHLCEYFRPMGKSYEKRIPNWVFGLSKNLLQDLFKWMMWGDGHTNKESGLSIAYYTSSRGLADDVQRLCLHIGKAGNAYVRENQMVGEQSSQIGDQKIVTRHPAWEVRIINSKFNPTINHSHIGVQHAQEEKWIEYTGNVWCCTLPKWHTLYVRRNGKAVWCGNSIPFGGKGVIGAIIPDDQMVKGEDGRPLDMLLSPLSVASRTNPAQLTAALLGKVAEKTGKPYILPGFSSENRVDFVQRELDKNGLKDTEDVLDPTTGKTIPKVFTGNIYTYVLQQMADSKGKARATDFYTQDDTPGRGGESGGKHFGLMELDSLLGYGAKDVIKDLKLVKGQKNDDFWRAVKMGKTPPTPGVPLVYEKFNSLIKAAGVNIKQENNNDKLFAMTNEQAKELTGTREIQNNKTFSAINLRPVAGGLFDPNATGSDGEGNRWAYIQLPEPVLNPIMESSVKVLLGITGKEFDSIISGDKPVNGKVGGAALQDMLKNINLDTIIREARNDMKAASPAKRDAALKKFTYAMGLVKNNVRPEEFMMDRVPVLPPRFRPINKVGGLTMVADLNHMYKNLIDNVEDFKDTADLPSDVRNPARAGVYNSYKALIGTDESDEAKLVQKNVGGVLQQLFGKGTVKGSFLQRRVLGADMDMSGLAVLAPDPTLHMDEVGLPEEKAWTLYEPFIIRNLVRKGVPATEAAKMVTIRDKRAFAALQDVIKERPVKVNRAPSLHKYSITALWPKLVKGDVLKLPPGIFAPYGADSDGNCCSGDSYICLRLHKKDLQYFKQGTYEVVNGKDNCK